MSLDKKAEIELLSAEKKEWQFRRTRSFIWATMLTGTGLLSAAYPFIYELEKIASRLENVSNSGTTTYSDNLTTAAVPVLGVLGGAFLGIGIYNAIRSANASTKADELTDRIKEIEQSLQYKAQKEPNQAQL